MVSSRKNQVTAAVVSALLVVGCSTPAQKAAWECGAKGAVLGAVGGGASGALASLATGKDIATGATIGAVAGAIAGGTLGAVNCYIEASHKSEKVEDYGIAKTALAYDVSQGNKVKATDLMLNPQTITVGNQLNIDADYYVMTPDETKDIAVTEHWAIEQAQEITKKDYVETQEPVRKKVGKKWRTTTKTVTKEVIVTEKVFKLVPDASIMVNVNMKPGKYKSTTSFPIDVNAPKGTYRLTLAINYAGQNDKIQREFIVQ